VRVISWRGLADWGSTEVRISGRCGLVKQSARVMRGVAAGIFPPRRVFYDDLVTRMLEAVVAVHARESDQRWDHVYLEATRPAAMDGVQPVGGSPREKLG
jgi:hypothetical protein